MRVSIDVCGILWSSQLGWFGRKECSGCVGWAPIIQLLEFTLARLNPSHRLGYVLGTFVLRSISNGDASHDSNKLFLKYFGKAVKLH
jgi:hypothetical protein